MTFCFICLDSWMLFLNNYELVYSNELMNFSELDISLFDYQKIIFYFVLICVPCSIIPRWSQ